MAGQFAGNGEDEYRRRKTVAVSGRVMRQDGAPHQGAQILAQIENLSPDGHVAGAREWTYARSASTDAACKFALALPPGRSRIEVQADGFVADRDDAELEVRADGPNEIPDFITEALAPIRGRVLDESGRPAPPKAGPGRRPGWPPRGSSTPPGSSASPGR